MRRIFAFKRSLMLIGVCVLLLGLALPLAAFARTTPGPAQSASKFTFKVVPFEFDPGKTMIVSAEWGRAQGLSDQRGSNNYALLLTKIGTTSTDAASGASITNVRGITLTELGFDVRADGHCGAGAPRFNVVTTDGTTHFTSCVAAPTTTTLIDPQSNSWNRKRFDLSSASTNVFPPFTAGEKVSNIQIVFDEGTDNGPGYAFLDNIDINGVLVGQP